jgi:hypothetical protein
MNQHQEHHLGLHALHHQEQSENHSRIDISDATAREMSDRESVLDELEKIMFERAK